MDAVCEERQLPEHRECCEQRRRDDDDPRRHLRRACRFSAVIPADRRGFDDDKPRRVAEAMRALGLEHMVVTSVDRDDLPDGRARIFAETIGAMRATSPGMDIEVLVPDFDGAGRAVADRDRRAPGRARPQPRAREAAPEARPQACRSDRSLCVLRQAERWPAR